MKSPQVYRHAAVRLLLAMALACVLVMQSLLGGGLVALAEPATPNIEITLNRLTDDNQPTGFKNKYQVTVKCEYLNGQESEDDCLTGGVLKFDGVPKDWNFEIGSSEQLSSVNSAGRTAIVKTIGKQGATFSFEVSVTPPNYVTPNNTSWDLTAALTSDQLKNPLKSETIHTNAVANRKLEVDKKALQESTWIGDTVVWQVAADINDGQKYKGLGVHRPLKVEFSDVLPTGFEPTEIRYAGQKVEFTYDKNSRKLQWSVEGIQVPEPNKANDVYKFEVHTKVTSAACQGKPEPCVGKSENAVTATAHYNGAADLTADAKASVSLAGRPDSRGVISKTAVGVPVKVGDATRKGIFPLRYQDANDKNWDGKALWRTPQDAYAADDRLNGDRSSLVAGGYTVDVAVYEGSTPVKDGSSLLPLTLSYEDDVPCMDPATVQDGFLYTSRTDGKLCQRPAFHVTAVEISTDAPGSLSVGDFVPVAVLTDGSRVPLTKLGDVEVAEKDKPKRIGSVVYSVPKSARGKVARIVAAPERPLDGAKTWKMTIGGFADEKLGGDAILRNQKARVTVTANKQTKPFIDGRSPIADLHLLGSLHHVEKTWSSIGNQFVPLEPNNEVSKAGIRWQVDFSFRGKTQSSGDIVVSDLLPRGMEIVTDPSKIHRKSGITDAVYTYDEAEFTRGVSGASKRKVETKVVENYQDGRTLVQWRIPHTWADPDPSGNVDVVGRFRFAAQPRYAGSYTNDVYLTDAAEPNFRCPLDTPEDVLNLDGDSATAKACHGASSWSIDAPAGYRALSLAKAVKGPEDASFAYTPKKAVVPAKGGPVTYRIEATNSSSDATNGLVFYDVLPHKGDTGVSEKLADQSRGSTQSGSFTAMTKVPQGVKVYYSASTNPCRPEVFPNAANSGCVNDWSETAPKNVTALKFVYDGELKPKQTLALEYTISVPVMKPTDVLWNSVAAKASFASGQSLPPVEAPKVGAARVAQPQFAVEKKSGKASAEDGKWSSTYTVTVKNTGPFEGKSASVADTPSLPKGFTLSGAKVDGATVDAKSGSFPVTDGVELAPGGSKTFKVEISGDYKAADVDWASVAKCETAGGGSVTGGLVNTVTMDGDTDGTSNNAACNPVKKAPKFAVKKEASGEASAANGKWSSTYKVTVSNTGEVKGTSKAVTDTPSVPAGFTVSGAKVDGKDTTLTDGSFTVTNGVELAPGESKTFTVVVSGSFDPARVKESEVLHCTGEEGVSDGKGFANGVTLDGDSDGQGNNTACTTVEKAPKFAVKKEASGKANAVNGKWSSTYKVTVTNTGVLAGKSPVVTDKPAAPKGFLITSAKIDKGEPMTLTNGEFTVSEGVELAPGESKSFTVVVLGTYVSGQADGAAASQCDAAVQDASKGGFFNQVTMKGDSDGSKNNTACTTVEKAPKFAVKKEASGKANAVNGKWSSAYKVTVTNTGVLAGKSAAVADTPSAPAGFQVENVSVDGADSTLKDGSFTVTDGVELAPGESKSFTVVVSGSFDPARVKESEVLQCAGDGAEGAHGFVNDVTLDGDSDGEGNNTACTTVEKAPKFAVKKEASGKANAVNGKWSSTYTVTVTNTGVLAGKSAAVVDAPSVPAGFQVEKATVQQEDAGEATEVALEDGSFTVTNGVELAPGESKSFTVVVSGSFDPARVKESEVLHCAGEEGVSDGKGFANGVTMAGDSDGEGNNTACTTVEKAPKFAVKKESGKASAVNGKWSSTYTVTVTNTGVLAGKSAAVADTPSVPAGFSLTNATVEGADVALADGSFTVTDGVELAPGESKAFTVVVSGSYRPADVDWTAAGQCGADGAEGAHGFVNMVAMPGDTDGEDNNTACNTVTKDPAFAVKKESGKASAVNGEWSSTYTVTVTNTGERAGKSAAVVDTPSVPAGFTVTGATVDGKRVAVKDGSFTVTDGVELGLGDAKSFTVVVQGSYSAKADWAKASRCDADGTASGLFNQVSMPGDSDGAANNTACNTVEKPKTPAVPQKPQKPSKPQKPVSGLPLPRTGAPIGLSAAAGVVTVLAGCVILVAGRRSRRS